MKLTDSKDEEQDSIMTLTQGASEHQNNVPLIRKEICFPNRIVVGKRYEDNGRNYILVAFSAALSHITVGRSFSCSTDGQL